MTLAPDTSALKVSAAVGGAVALGVAMLGGFLGALFVFCGLAAVGRILQSRSVAYRCTECGATIDEQWTRPFERELASEMRTRLRWQGLGMGLASLGSVVALVLFVKMRTGPVDIAALEHTMDVAALSRVVVADDDQRYKAAAALGRLGAEGVKELDPLLRHEDWRVRRAACNGLEEAKSAAAPAVPALVALIDRQEDTVVTGDAIRALGEMGPSAASAAPLLERMSSDLTLGYVAKESLRKIRAADR